MLRSPALLVFLLTLSHLLFDAFVSWLTSGNNDPWIAISIGICTSQVTLIAFWMVFAAGPVVWRIPWGALLGSLMWGSIILGNRLTHWSIRREDAIFLGGFILGGILVAQFPLWFLRLGVGYRLYSPGARPDEQPQFHLRQLMLGIAVLSISLALIQAILPPPAGLPWDGPDDLLELATVFTIVAATNVLLTTPCLWLALHFSLRQAIPLAAGLVVYVVAVTALEIAVVTAFQGQSDPMLIIVILNLTQTASVTLTLALLRTAGFTWRRKPATNPISLSAAESTPAPPPTPHPLDS